MATFLPALRRVLDEEGGFVDDPVDRGGATKYGITLRTLGEWWDHLGHERKPTRSDVQMLTETEATQIYRLFWWERYKFGQLADQSVAEKLFDLAVNMGPRTAIRLAQRALGIEADGHIGQQTISALNRAIPAMLLTELRRLAAEHYRAIVERDPSQSRFLRGWLSRAAR